MNLIIGLIIFVALLAIWFISVGNRLNRYLVTIEESKRTVDIVLVKRYDTISEMLKVAKAYAKHEQQIFTDLVALPKEQLFKNPTKSLPIKMMSWHKFVQWVKTIQSSCLLINSWPTKEIADENEDLAAAKRIVNSNVNTSIKNCFLSSVYRSRCKGIHQVPFLAEETQGKERFK